MVFSASLQTAGASHVSIVCKGCFEPINWGKKLGRWIEDAIQEKIEREERVKTVK